jgi:hypothetical protein
VTNVWNVLEVEPGRKRPAAASYVRQNKSVNSDRDVPEEPDDENESEDESISPVGEQAPEGGHWPLGSVPSLDAFAAIQRHLASIDFSAITAAQRAIEQAGVFKVIEAQDAIVKNFARSFDFSHLTDTYRTIIESSAAAQAVAVQQQWAESLARSIDFTALSDAAAASAALTSYTRTSAAFDESLRKQTEYLAQIAKQVTFNLPTVDIAWLREALGRWIPTNLREVTDLDVVATIALDEGLPLSWVPREEVVVLLVEADSAEARFGILTAAGRKSSTTASRHWLPSHTSGHESAAVRSPRCVLTWTAPRSLTPRTSSTASCSACMAATVAIMPGRAPGRTSTTCSWPPRTSRCGRCSAPLRPGIRTRESSRPTTSLATPRLTLSAMRGCSHRSPHWLR